MGQRRKSLKILKLHGSQYANPNFQCSKDRESDLAAEFGIPPCPSWLSKEAKNIWKEVSAELDKMGILALSDANILAMYCETQAQWQNAAIFINKHGMTYECNRLNKHQEVIGTETKIHPVFTVFNMLCSTLNKLSAELGLTPLARTRLRSSAKPRDKESGKSNEIEEFLDGTDSENDKGNSTPKQKA